MIKALFTGWYSRTDHSVFSEIPFNKSSHCIGTSRFIYIENWPVFVRHKSLLKSISEHTPQSVHKYISVKTVPQRSQQIYAYGNQLTGLCMIRAHPERYFRTVIIARAELSWHGCSTVTGIMLQQSLARLFNSRWHNYATVAGTILQLPLARLFNSHRHDCSTVTGLIVRQSLARLFISRWHEYSTVADTIIQQSLARFFNSHWHDSSTVTGTILQQWLARFFNSHGQDFFLSSMLAELFNSDVHCRRIVPCTRNTTHDPVSFLSVKTIFFLLRKKKHCDPSVPFLKPSDVVTIFWKFLLF